MRLALLLLLTATLPTLAQQHIAPTNALSPADELKTFRLPPGFKAQLVAAEPDIGKPIQIAFDARGRLWVTTSRHYPFAAEGKATDKLYVLSDIGDDGKAKTVTTFADDLNIPIGILPLPDGKSCLVSSAGEIRKYTDTDGDGKADKHEVILSGFGVKDTHGMYNSFVLLPDGWVYACHGFNNDSTVKAKDGSVVRMVSGNTFRFRPDGSRIEPWTFGQVNPFGMTVDPSFNIYTADCHSKPITQLIRGAYYDSFGKPHDGLGYAPHVTRHDHGSTALCGLAWYHADHFPATWNGCMFLGNVVTNRINADRIVWKGSTPEAVELPDFLTSSDPWFRPTDIKMGPDGALYFADFYNKIIGHYEVDLRHPLRDKDRGRVWRIVYSGTDGSAPMPKLPTADIAKRDIKEVMADVVGKNLTVRIAAANEVARRVAADPTTEIPGDGAWLDDPEKMSVGFGVIAMIGETTGSHNIGPEGYRNILKEVKSKIEADPTKFTGLTIRAMGTRTSWGEIERQVAAEALTISPNALQIRRAAVDGMIAHPHEANVLPLLALLRTLPADDTHLRHAARVALRNALRDGNGWPKSFDVADGQILAEVALGIPTRAAASFLLDRVTGGMIEPKYCETIGRYGDDAQAAAAAAAAKPDASTLVALLALFRGIQARGGQPPTEALVAACSRGLASTSPVANQAAIDLAIGLKATAVFESLVAVSKPSARLEPIRANALAALMAVDEAKATPILAARMADTTASYPIRERAAQVLAGSAHPPARAAVLTALPTAPARVQAAAAIALAGSPTGADALLEAIKSGKASARLLQDKAVSTKILAHDGGQRQSTVTELTKGLPSADAKIAALIATRAAAFPKAPADPIAGQKVFAQHCAVCHQIGGVGAKIGPNLDGVGIRGADRLCEDLLDPNRNVDAAFRATVLNLVDGRTITGLLLREEGKVLVLADAAGKELRIDGTDVEKRTTSLLSAMPANVETLVPEADFHHLLAYLLSLRAK